LREAGGWQPHWHLFSLQWQASLGQPQEQFAPQVAFSVLFFFTLDIVFLLFVFGASRAFK